MKVNKLVLLASASIVMLGMGVSSKAQAFDDVDWSWNKDVNQVENININVRDTFDWSGLVEVEKIQANIGDVSATSRVANIKNNPPAEGGSSGPISVNETFTFQVPYEDATDPDTILPSGPIAGSNGQLEASILSGEVDEGVDIISDLVFQVTGEFDPEVVGGALDAVDLPEVASVATAVANNQSISTTTAVNLHDAQYNFGGFADDSELGSEDLAALAIIGAGADQTGNTHTDAALGLTLAGALGIITPGTVSADSTVTNILNASVDSSATAVGNNLSVSVDPTQPGDAFLVADLTQFNYADVSATSTVDNVQINNYSNLGVLDKPLVNSVATAVGNNVSIKVGDLSE
jgi:hypothetical protein